MVREIIAQPQTFAEDNVVVQMPEMAARCKIIKPLDGSSSADRSSLARALRNSQWRSPGNEVEHRTNRCDRWPPRAVKNHRCAKFVTENLAASLRLRSLQCESETLFFTIE